jgi:septal ring factor EnvC (AmiA/AmiB activator)
MAKLKKDLQAVTRELKALTKKTERLMKAVDKLEKAQAAKKPRAGTKAKAKTTRKAPAKKKTTAKKKSPAKKKATKLTATEQVLKIIKRSKKGVDVPTLMKKTRFDDKKVRNIVSRAFSQGNIKRTGRGLYAGA